MSFKDLKKKCVTGELGAIMSKHCPVRKQGFVKIGEKKWFLPYKFAEEGDKIYSFETRPDDTWIISYPRSGTTMMQELVWLVANDLNFDEAHRKTLLERCPYLECSLMLEDHMFETDTPEKQKLERYSVEFLHDMSSPRFIKSHMPFDLLPTVVKSNCKIIYVARNPRNVLVSWYNFQKNIKYFQYQGTFEEYCDHFINDNTFWNPYWAHIKAAWAMRNRANMLFFFYEDLRKDLAGSIKKVAAFLNKIYSDEQIAKLVEHLNIDNFRKNSMVNQPSPACVIEPEQFIRQGKTESWKEIFTPQIEERFSKWIADNLKNTDLIFPN